jgi:hypothetical protein
MPSPLEPRGDRPAPLVFRQGENAPFAVRWYGVTSLFGHFRNFAARAIATESVDSRDWMRPLEADELLRRMVRVLGGDERRRSLVEALGRPLWIDFVADTGDDRDVSAAVGRMVFADYAVGSPKGTRALPRGDMLMWGGDTAYPVGTVEEIHRRVVQPWNEVLREQQDDGRARVLLGVPGNHDWYDGLDGFARFFRRSAQAPERSASDAQPSGRRRRRGARRASLVARELHLDEVGSLLGLVRAFLRGVRAFLRGVSLKRRKRLTLAGYEAVQEASYWALPLAPDLDLWGLDRQLGQLDFRQRRFFHQRRRTRAKAKLMVVAADPAVAFGEPHEPGARMLTACKLSFERDRILFVTGDMHHYERRVLGESTHVIAGGGGAFLHGTRINPIGVPPAACAYPDAATTRWLVAQVPWKLMLGRAGLLVHLALALIGSLELGADLRGHTALFVTAALVSLGLSVGLYAIAGHRRAHPWRVAAVAVPFGAALGALPMALKLMLPRVVPTLAGNTAVMVVYALAGAFLFGLFLATVAIAGFEHQQAFAVLGHPGFKHFMRMCVSPDGTVEAWTIGKDDALAPGEPQLIDHWKWGAASAQASGGRAMEGEPAEREERLAARQEAVRAPSD